MNYKHFGLIFALMAGTAVLGTPALAAVISTHDPSRETFSPSASIPLEKILEITHNEERSLPLECRGYNVSEKSRREAVTRPLNRCE
jgi:hypothetical protein